MKITNKQTLTARENRRSGFTLIEVIVVAVIVLILSAVAIPMYNGYVRQAKQDVVDNLAETGAAAANTIWRRTTKAPNVAELKLHYNAENDSIYMKSDSVCAHNKKEDSIKKCVSFK